MPNKKKSSSPIVWHTSLAKSRSNLHHESWEKQNFIYALPPLENLHQESFSILYFFFTLPPTGKRRWQPQSAHAYIRVGRWVLPSFYFRQVGLPNCWRLFSLILPKLDGCQVDLPNCWSCSARANLVNSVGRWAFSRRPQTPPCSSM
jgi:hypothetical protein